MFERRHPSAGIPSKGCRGSMRRFIFSKICIEHNSDGTTWMSSGTASQQIWICTFHFGCSGMQFPFWDINIYFRWSSRAGSRRHPDQPLDVTSKKLMASQDLVGRVLKVPNPNWQSIFPGLCRQGKNPGTKPCDPKMIIRNKANFNQLTL